MTYRLVEFTDDIDKRVWISDLDTLFDADRHAACPAKARKMGLEGVYCQRAFFLIEPDSEGGNQ